jgi:hypothetical protein
MKVGRIAFFVARFVVSALVSNRLPRRETRDHQHPAGRFNRASDGGPERLHAARGATTRAGEGQELGSFFSGLRTLRPILIRLAASPEHFRLGFKALLDEL